MGFIIGTFGPFLLNNLDYYYLSKSLHNYGLNLNDLGYKKDISVETQLKPKGFLTKFIFKCYNGIFFKFKGKNWL